MTNSLTTQFVADLQRLMKQGADEAAAHQVKRCLLDYLGATLAGAKILESRINQIMDFAGQNANGVSVIGCAAKAGLETAGLLNGLSSHVAEMDDGVRFGMIHPGAPIFSVLLPVAEKLNVSGDKFIVGVLVGYDAALRLASAMHPSHYQRGYHPTATCGCIGATMGIAAMLDFDAAKMENALGAAAVSAAGSLKVVDKGSELKPYNVGRAAVIAVHSAMMAQAGFAAPTDSLEGETGFLKMTSDFYQNEKLFAQAPDKYWIHSVYVKPYAACRHAHPSIEAAIDILNHNPISLADIKNITITTYHGLAGRHDHTEVSDVAAARMSIPYSVAVALKAGAAGIDEFTQDVVNDTEIRNLAKKFTISAEQSYTDRVPEQRAARLQMQMNDGRSFQHEVTYPKGEPENPMTDQELEAKYIALARYGKISVAKIDSIKNAVWDLPANMNALYPLLSH